MATVAQIRGDLHAAFSVAEAETRLLLYGIPFDVYEALRSDDLNNHVRMTYLDGDLELMSPGQRHDRYAIWLGLFVIELARVLGFPIRAYRSTTWKKKGRGKTKGKGKEADECFHIASYARVRKKIIDLKVDPPPDLAIEVEISPSDLDMMKVYAGLKVPEVWRFDGETLTIQVLGADGTYRECAQSPGLPFLHTEEVENWMIRGVEIDDDARFCEEVRAWAIEVLGPRNRANQGQ